MSEVSLPPSDVSLLEGRARFVGRAPELDRLGAALADATAGRGRVAFVSGEPGIGKTRIAMELADEARRAGAIVWWGTCEEGEWSLPYGPFVDALADHIRTADLAELGEDLGTVAPVLARVVPALRNRLPDLPEPVALAPDEERVRLFDAVAQLVLTLSLRAPLVLVLDDLQWAGRATLTLLRHLARFVPRHRVLIVGLHRIGEIGERAAELEDALGTLGRDPSCEIVTLRGLEAAEVGELVSAFVGHAVPATRVAAIEATTEGNPFFVREIVRHLSEVRRLDGDVGSDVPLPTSVRHVIVRRIGRLEETTQRWLAVAAAFDGPFDFLVSRHVADLDEGQALTALDEALEARVVRAGSATETYEFTHALIRHTLYAELSPSRQVRLHRRIAEAIEAIHAANLGEHAGQAAYQYAKSAALPGAESGVDHALATADRAEAAYAYDSAVTFLRIALALAPTADPRRRGILSRLGLALGWERAFDETVPVAFEAAELIADNDGAAAAAKYLSQAANTIVAAGSIREAWKIASRGLEYAGTHHDLTWAELMRWDWVRRGAEDPTNPGIFLDSPEIRELAHIFEKHGLARGLTTFPVESRLDLLTRSGDAPLHVGFFGGDLRRGRTLWREYAAETEARGELANTVMAHGQLARTLIALGDFSEASDVIKHAEAIAERVTEISGQMMQLHGAKFDWRFALDIEWDTLLAESSRANFDAPELYWLRAAVRSNGAVVFGRIGQREMAIGLVATLGPALALAPPWSPNYPMIACDGAEALWLCDAVEHIDVIRESLERKVLVTDFRYPLRDARLAMARICALQQQYDEAMRWFAAARVAVDEQGARPVRAIVDYDEALMFLRRSGDGDAERAAPLLDAALRQFRMLGMPGWIRRAETLQAGNAATESTSTGVVPTPGPALEEHVFRLDGDYWTIAYDGREIRLRDMRGLRYLVCLLDRPGSEIHVGDLVGIDAGPTVKPGNGTDLRVTRDLGDAGERLDAQARDEYRRRVAELRDEIHEAEQMNDLGRVEHLRPQLDALMTELSAAGRGRRAASHGERARLTVTKGIKSALAKIAASHPSLGAHLRATIRRGYFCVYVPDPRRPIRWNT